MREKEIERERERAREKALVTPAQASQVSAGKAMHYERIHKTRLGKINIARQQIICEKLQSIQGKGKSELASKERERARWQARKRKAAWQGTKQIHSEIITPNKLPDEIAASTACLWLGNELASSPQKTDFFKFTIISYPYLSI